MLNISAGSEKFESVVLLARALQDLNRFFRYMCLLS